MAECIQCGHEAPGKYCANCGQKQHIARLSVKTFFTDFLSRVYGLDGAMPRTLIGLSRNPGAVIREYVRGIRGKYVGPVGYYFLLFAVYLLLFKITGVSIDDYSGSEDFQEVFQNQLGQEAPTEVTPFQQTMRNAVLGNIQFFILLSFPFISWWGMLFFRKSGYNFLENMVFSFYTQAHMVLFNILGILLYVSTGTKFRLLMSLFGTIYFVVAASQYFKNKINFASVVKSLLLFVVSYISFFVSILLSVIFVGNIKSWFE